MKLIVVIIAAGISAVLPFPQALPKAQCVAGKDLELAAFNIQVFGDSKMNKADVMTHLIRICKRFHMVVVQEIRQSEESVRKSGAAIDKLRDQLNADAKDCPSTYNGKCWTYVIGDRRGRSDSKEQYAYLYRADRVEVLKQINYPDENDYFQRGPFIISFKDRCSTKLPETAMMVLHSEPTGAFEEIQNLKKVYEWASGLIDFKNIKNWIITGDLNMDCSYVSSTKQKEVWFANDPKFKLYIGDLDDTTVAESACAYDRFILSGDIIKLVSKVAIDRMDMDSKGAVVLPNSETKRISDHYPIVLTLKTA